MGSVLDFESATRKRVAKPAAAFGLVRELVDSEDPARSKGRPGVIYIGDLAVVCVVEQVPAVGDTIGGEAPGIVEKVSITRRGRVLIHARRVPAHLS